MTAPLVDVDYLVVGAGISGLAFANQIIANAQAAGLPRPTVQVCEAEAEAGGYCRTVQQDGFVWDYSGHFFHFKQPAIEAWLNERMPDKAVRTVHKRSFIRFAGTLVDFPFQKNIHQLPQQDFIDCLHDLYFRVDDGQPPRSFLDMVVRRFGRGIAERFLIPYNEKLYACDLDALDVDAMGRFFPHADIADIVRNMKAPANASYNATFSYPAGGAMQYVRALLADLAPGEVALGEPVQSIDVAARLAHTPTRTVRYRHLVSSAPLPKLLGLVGETPDPSLYSWNRVLVFNLGFDRKGWRDIHWLYVPDRARSFYRVGWYDNIFDTDRMSLYVEIGAPRGTTFDVEALRLRVLEDLAAEGITDGHQLVSWHHVVLDPAYVHITQRSIAEVAAVRARLGGQGVHSIGRYGGWTYCSIEDNIIEARALADRLATA